MPDPSASVPSAVKELHSWFCQRTGLQTRLCFSERLWFDRLRDYNYDSDELQADCELIIKYLRREIAQKADGRSGRNVGALKLSNFLQPDNFDADLAIAKLESKKNRSRKQESRKPETARPQLTSEEIESRRQKFRDAVTELRENLKGK
jgi:hypothetical protein